LSLAGQAAAQKSTAASLPPVRIILVGDSTMAINNGWGPGFCAVVVREVTCRQRGKNGRQFR